MKPADLARDLREGEGTPIIFIHGWLGSRKFWQLITPYLEIENPLIFYDQRCHGDSPCSKFKVETLAEDLENLIKELE
ncbi:MAG: alpha/beta fold hydrolase, partial [Candidatus Aenigmatarchaeota archaeon]